MKPVRLLLLLVTAIAMIAGCGSPAVDEPAAGADADLPPVDGPNLFPFCEGDLWGYINRSGEVVIAPRFERGFSFSERLARAWGPDGDGYIDESGNFVVSPPAGASHTKAFSEGLAAFAVGRSRDRKWGFFDRDGTVVVPPKYDQVRPFSQGLAAVNAGATYDPEARDRFGGKWGYIDKTGREVIELEHCYALDFSEGLALVRKGLDDPYCYVDGSGKLAFELRYASDNPAHRVARVNSFSEGLASVAVDGLGLGFVDKTGKFVIDPRFPCGMADFREGLAAVPIGEKWGYVDRSGEFVIEPRFDGAQRFSEGLAAARIGDHWGYIDKQGQPVVDPDRGPAQGPGLVNEAEDFSAGLALVHIGGTLDKREDAPWIWTDGAWYYINRRGEIVHLYERDPEH